MENLLKVKAALQKRGFQAHLAQDKKGAAELAADIIGGGSVGFGGSLTVQAIGLYGLLEKNGNPLYWHWTAGASQKRLAAEADYYVCSANALTEDGIPVLTDGSGNRVAALSCGPKNAILIVGKNKIVKDLPAAFARIKSGECAGSNAARLKFDLPCARTGECTDCDSPQRICSVTAFFEKPSAALKSVHVILVNEILGY